MANSQALCRILIASASMLALPAFAIQPVVIKHERLEIDWAAPSVRFFGEAKSGDLKGIEGAAWTEGVNYLTSKGDLQSALRLPADFKLEPTKANIRSFNTVYFTDGRVRIHLESPLLAMIEGAKLPSEGQKILVRLNKYTDPRLDFKIVDAEGNMLMAGLSAASQPPKVTIARWFRGQGLPPGADGSEGTVISGTVASDLQFVVSASEWREKKFDATTEPQVYFLMP